MGPFEAPDFAKSQGQVEPIEGHLGLEIDGATVGADGRSEGVGEFPGDAELVEGNGPDRGQVRKRDGLLEPKRFCARIGTGVCGLLRRAGQACRWAAPELGAGWWRC